MPEYRNKFKKVLNEYDIPDIDRNEEDANLGLDTDPDAFNVKGMGKRLGYAGSTLKGDTETLKSITKDVASMQKRMKDMIRELTELQDSFGEIGKVTKTVSDVNKKLLSLQGDLDEVWMTVPAQKEEEAPEEEAPAEISQGEEY